MLSQVLLASAFALEAVLACPQHNNNQRYTQLHKRATAPGGGNGTGNDWAYEASYNWGQVNPDYSLCQTGTQQSPIALSLGQGLSLNHVPTFNYNGSIQGNFYNWGYGPAFTVAHDGDWTTHPSFQYDNVTLYLKGWHIHAPADHTVSGKQSKAEMHLVHVNAEGEEAAVLALRLDPGNANSSFFEQMPPMVSFRDLDTQVPIELDFIAALDGVMHFNEFWTYEGSLTSPPCTEGIRWFVARQILFTGVDQMREILGASTYSARATQFVWQHRINQ
ncbi:carbonic anhydrase [Corynespora cassiicola Philippines]|uniref:Carbonic anhydrase n=1 Tax=Corynespora cassiicola Philippines TaxID=1448308 RepID=A0A2T2PA77_CORCC|nr:carbonic anhydrase [Corynespora cassiicola Philippines]